jgi:integrase
MDEQAEAIGAGEIAPKTVNNSLGTLVVCLNAAVEDGLIASNPAMRVERLPAAHIEREYLRLHEIPLYLDSRSDVYRPLAELLIGSGLRISEALALNVGDMELESTGGSIVVYRSRKRGETIGSTKYDRFRSVEIGPGLSRVLRDYLARRAELASGDGAKAHVFAMPVRVLKRDRGRGGKTTALVGRWTGRPSRATGTSRRCRTRRCGTCRCTRCDIRPPRRGSRRATR